MKAWVVALAALAWTSAAKAAEKPAAVQICLEGAKGIALFSDTPRRNYRALAEGGYVLDLDVTMDGRAPERISKGGGASCLRAWVLAGAVSAIRVSFDRTDLNLVPQERAVKLKLKPDLWYDGGSFAVERGAYSKVSTALPGEFELQRLEDAPWSKGPFPMKDLSQVPQGNYSVLYAPPAPGEGSCEITVRVVATGTVTTERNARLLAELVETYQKEYAPEVAKSLKATCTAAQALEMRVAIVDGIYRDAWNPRITKIKRLGREKKYELVVDGQRSPFANGQFLALGFGQSVELVEASPAEHLASAAEQAAAR
ncbi:MAG: hypothetical protein QM765_29855 [Myxococcales bacterium]